MKGIVFSEFLEMVESKFSADMVDDIIEDNDLPSGGAYTSVGTYDHQELMSLVQSLSQKTGANVPALLQTYGHHMFGRFVEGYPVFFDGVKNSFDFLISIEDYIHVEVRKLYPDAELPEFDSVRVAPDKMSMVYRSPRCMGDFAQGLMTGCFEYFEETIELQRNDEHNGKVVRFDLTLSN